MTAWSWPKRFGFCFLTSFIVLSSFPIPFSYLPFGARLFAWVDSFWRVVVPIFGAHVFHVQAHYVFLGSADTLFDYVRLALWGVLSVVIAIVWSWLDRDSVRYDRASKILQVYLRYVLAVLMVSYGAGKIFSNQFPRPPLDVLILPYGSSTPMRLAWTFMGASPLFQRFAGWAEMTSALLLTTRRTTLIGTLMAIGILVNVAAFNIYYDVAAKIPVLHMLLLAIVLVSFYSRRLVDFFLLNRATQPAPLPPLFETRWKEAALVALRTLFIAGVMVRAIHYQYVWRRQVGDLAPRSPLYGIWNIDLLEDNGVMRPPLVTDTTRWRYLVFDGPVLGTLYDMDYTLHRFRASVTPSTIVLRTPDGRKTLVLTYKKLDAGGLVIDTNDAGHTIHAVCHRMADKEFLLLAHQTHWLNEYPVY